MINKVILIGNLGADPEIRYTQNGAPVASFTVATTEKWKDQSGNDRYTTEIVAREMKMLSPRASGGGGGEYGGGSGPGYGSGESFQEPPPMGEDVPF